MSMATVVEKFCVLISSVAAAYMAVAVAVGSEVVLSMVISKVLNSPDAVTTPPPSRLPVCPSKESESLSDVQAVKAAVIDARSIVLKIIFFIAVCFYRVHTILLVVCKDREK